MADSKKPGDPGFSGTITDSLGRKITFVNGVRVQGTGDGKVEPVRKDVGGVEAFETPGGFEPTNPAKERNKNKPPVMGILEPEKPLLSQAPEGTKINPATYVGKAERERFQTILGTDDWVLRKVTSKDVEKLDAIAAKLKDPEQWETLNKIINKVDNAVMAGGYSFIPKGVIKPPKKDAKPLPVKAAGGRGLSTIKPSERDKVSEAEAAENRKLSRMSDQELEGLGIDRRTLNEWMEKNDEPVRKSEIKERLGLKSPKPYTGGPVALDEPIKPIENTEAKRESVKPIERESLDDRRLREAPAAEQIKPSAKDTREPLYPPPGDPNKRGIENTKGLPPQTTTATPTHSILSQKSPFVKETDRPMSRGRRVYANIIHNQVEPTPEEYAALVKDLPKLGRDQLMRLVRRFKIPLSIEHHQKVKHLRKGVSDHVADLLEYGAGPTGVAPELGKDRRSGKHSNENFTQFRPVRKF